MKTKKRIIRVLTILLAMTCLFSITADAYATGDDYPNKNSCTGCHSIANGDDHNDYNERLFYYRQCTDFCAWCLVSRNGVTNFNNRYGGLRWGNAKDWDDAARSIGIAVDNTPAVGAIAYWESGSYGHVAWVREVNDNTVTIEEYNNYNYKPYAFCERTIAKSNPSGYIHVKDIPTNKDPYGALDECSGGYGTIHVRGWAKDDDALNESLTVKVCVGGTLGSSAPSYTITANKSRSDVGGNYGFDETIKVNATGTQSVYVYAINKPDGNNPCIGSASAAIQTCSHPSWSSVITRQATCTKEGLETLTCTTCGTTKTQAIPKVDHTPETDPAVPPTITSTGLTEGSHCSVCGLVLVEQEIVPMLPRVLHDFDLDGIAEPVISLPKGLDTIEPNAFEGSGAEVVIIPDGVTDIGGRAFAEMPNLKAVFFPETVKKITFDIFENSPNVTLYVQKGSKWGTRLDLPYVEIETDWVSEGEVPAGAVITDERWKYDYVVSETKKTTSPITEEGWVLVSTDWETISTDSQKCVDGYPSGFHGSQNYTTDKWSSFTNDLMKREVSTSIYTYTYWHWCFNSGYVSSGNYNIFVSDIPYEVDNKGRYYQYFTWLESSTNAGHIDPNGVNGGDCFYYWRNTPSDGSWWWFRFPVYQQTKVDKQKVYTYSRIINETRISPTPVDESETIKNVRHEVLYSFD